MVSKDKKIPFPQANDFEKIIKILELDEEKLLDKEYLLELLGVGSYRQAHYYISACQFLKLIDINFKFTETANFIRKSSYDTKVLMLSRLIISAPVFGEVFFKKYLYGECASNEEIAQLIWDLWTSEDCYAVCLRRASTVRNWLKWIDSNIE